MEHNADRETWDEWKPEHSQIDAAHQWLDFVRRSGTRTLRRTTENFLLTCNGSRIGNGAKSRLTPRAQGVALMGDIPFGISYYSADVFAHPEQFALDWSGGAPPEPYFKDDAFTQKWGQNWGIPVYRWDLMRSRNFDWWRQRVRWSARDFSPLSHRSRAWVLPHLRLPLAAVAQSRVSPPRLGGNARPHSGSRAAFLSASRQHLGKLRG